MTKHHMHTTNEKAGLPGSLWPILFRPFPGDFQRKINSGRCPVLKHGQREVVEHLPLFAFQAGCDY